MDISANPSNRSRAAISVDPALGIGDVMNLLAKSLAHQGPALNFSSHDIDSVSEEIALIIETTGSTGGKKLVALSAQALLASAKASLEYVGARPGQTWALLLPIHHIAGVNVLIRGLELGTIPIDLRDVSQYPVADFSAVVPTHIYRALNGDAELLTHLKKAKKVLVGGAKLTDELLRQASDAGISIIQTYGMSETAGGCVYDGKPIGNTHVRISSDQLIEISGSVLASGYLNDPDLWNRQCKEGWFTTSDTGSIDGTGFLTIAGRSDDLYITGGEKVSLNEVNDLLALHFPSNQWSALAVDDQQWGQRLVIAGAGQDLPSSQDVAALLEGKLGEFAKPKQYLTFDQLPLIGIGKIDRMAIIARAKDEFSGN